MRFNYDCVPQELKTLKRWVLWKKRDNTKLPINANNGYGAKSNDSSTWTTYEIAKSKCDYYNCEGLGFMLGNGYFGVDIDHAIEDKNLISEFTNALDGSYIEVSQSGEGIHIICKGVLPKGARRKENIEMYDNARFFALTGNLYAGIVATELKDNTDKVKALWNKYLNREEEGYVFHKNEKVIINNFTTLSDEEIITKARESQNGNLFTCLYYGQWEGLFPSQSEADMSFCSQLAFWCNRDSQQMDRIFRSSKLYRQKWDELRGENTYGQITIANAIAHCRDGYTPAFNQKTQSYDVAKGEIVNKSSYDLNDTGNAQRFIDRFGSNIRYNFDNKCWVIFDGKTWIRDIKQIVKTQADIMIEEMKVECAKEPDKDTRQEMAKNIKHLSSNSGKEAMLKEAMHIGSVPTTNSDYDKNIYLLNTLNGVIDLKTGKLLPHDRTLMMSKNTNIVCDLEHEPTQWIKFLHEIFKGDSEMVDYIQTAVGYTLTGDTKEQCLFQCYGDGANGKSVFLDIVYSMLGDYALNSQVDSILAKGGNGGNANSEIARMNGARFIRTNEPNEGSRFNEGLVKQLVSGDITTARFLYGMEFEFTPRFKLWIATNYKILVRGTDYGIWRRMRLVPFEEKFEGSRADKHLTEKLMQELPQILGWAVNGAMIWQEKGLLTPAKIELANNQYKQENDIISSFLKDCTKSDLSKREKASDIFAEYSQWAKQGNEYCMNKTKFGIEMSKRFEKKNINGYIYYIGILLNKNDESYVFEKENV